MCCNSGSGGMSLHESNQLTQAERVMGACLQGEGEDSMVFGPCSSRSLGFRQGRGLSHYLQFPSQDPQCLQHGKY